MPTPEKEAAVAALAESVDSCSGIYLSDMSGITAEGMNALRGTVIKSGGRLQIAKNRLLKRAIEGKDCEGLAEYLTGPTVLMFCEQDPISPAKALKEFSEKLDANKQSWTLKAAFVDGQVYDGQGALALAGLPTIDEIRASVVGAIAGPLNAMVQTTNGLASDLVYTLKAIADKREAEGA